MVLSLRDLITILHGMGFGVLFMLAFSGAIGLIYTSTLGSDLLANSPRHTQMFRFYLISMAILSWLAVLSGTYIIYPWYRAVPPQGTTDLALYPQRLLLSNPMTAGWHDVGMEWKEHVSWFTPIAITMVAYLFLQHGPSLARHRHTRAAVLGFTAAAFLATLVSGFFGAMLNTHAPIAGGPEIILMGPK
jgi:hypothetical protein